MFFLIRFYVVLDIGASPLAAWELPKIPDHVVMASLFTFYEWTWVLYYDIPGHVYLYYQFFKEIFLIPDFLTIWSETGRKKYAICLYI